MKPATPKPERPQPEDVTAITEVLRIADFGLSTEAIRCILNRRGDPKIQNALEWMREQGVLISRTSRVNATEIWELKTPDAVKRAEVRFR